MTKQADGNWTRFRTELGLTADDEVDLHFGRRDPHTSYDEVMSAVMVQVEAKLREAQAAGRRYVMFIHGWSTSRMGATTARSVVRQFMRSPAATPLIDRRESIQHDSVFIARVKAVG